MSVNYRRRYWSDVIGVHCGEVIDLVTLTNSYLLIWGPCQASTVGVGLYSRVLNCSCCVSCLVYAVRLTGIRNDGRKREQRAGGNAKQ